MRLKRPRPKASQPFFFFEYAGAGAFDKRYVISIISMFLGLPAYYHYRRKQLVSIFNCSGRAVDWEDIESEAGSLELGTPDGVFGWAGWPWGNQGMDKSVGASYLNYLDQTGGKVYMMPNWLWGDRWEDVMVIQPELAFSVGKAPFNYAKIMLYDGWLSWYRRNPSSACKDSDTTGNTAKIAQDKVFYSALLTSSAIVTATVGITISCSGSTIAEFSSPARTTSCTAGYAQLECR
ncbi:hypothetical protein BDW71DRAFT_196640 [Aspergillus fruticulosus]